MKELIADAKTECAFRECVAVCARRVNEAVK